MWKTRKPIASAEMEPRINRKTEMRWPVRVSGLGTVKDSASVASSLSHAAMRRINGGSDGRT